MINKLKITFLNKSYLPIDRLKSHIKAYGPLLLELDKNDQLFFSKDHNKISYFLEEEEQLSNENVTDPATIDKYWNMAAKDFKREIFMNTLRPILKDKLEFNFSEVNLEEKAKLLCVKWYQAQEKGEKYNGPYLIDE